MPEGFLMVLSSRLQAHGSHVQGGPDRPPGQWTRGLGPSPGTATRHINPKQMLDFFGRIESFQNIQKGLKNATFMKQAV